MRTLLAALALALLPVLPTLAAAAESSILITKRDCRKMVRHLPSGDVAYQPGVDVRGKKVVSADVGGRQKIKLPDVFEFDIGIDMRRYMGGPAADAAAESAETTSAFDAAARIGPATSSAGKVRYDINTGGLSFNGQPLTDPDEAALIQACKKMLARGK